MEWNNYNAIDWDNYDEIWIYDEEDNGREAELNNEHENEDLGKIGLQNLIEQDKERQEKHVVFVQRNYWYNTIYHCPGGNQEKKKRTKYAQCRACGCIITNGGNQEKNHRESACKMIAKNSKPVIAVTAIEKTQFLTALAHWCAMTGQSFSVVKGQAFLNVFETFQRLIMERGGPFDVKSLVPVPNTVRNKLNSLTESLREDKLENFAEKLSVSGASFSLDYGKHLRDYLSVSLHFIDSDWRLHMLSIAMKRCEFTKKTSEQVWVDLVESFSSFGINEALLNSFYSISDEAANLKKCLRDNTAAAINCVNHVLNTTMKRMIWPYKDGSIVTPVEDEVFLERARRITQLSKIIAQSVRNTAIEKGLSGAVLDVITRWISKFFTLRWVKTNLDELLRRKLSAMYRNYFTDELVQSIEELYSLRGDMEVVYRVMELFEKPVKFFETSKYPTIHLVWPKWIMLKRNFTELAAKSTSFLEQALARSALRVMLKKESDGFISDTHKMATFLHPSFRKLSHVTLDPIEREKVFNSARALLQQTHVIPLPIAAPGDHTILDDLPIDNEALDFDNEFDRYQDANFGQIPDSILEFWKENGHRFPIFARHAMLIFSLPGSTACEERKFSWLKFSVNDKRTRLDAELISNMFLYKSLCG